MNSIPRSVYASLRMMDSSSLLIVIEELAEKADELEPESRDFLLEAFLEKRQRGI